MRKRLWITIAIILGVIILSIFLINSLHNGVSSETSKCIGKNSVLYIQLGCHACEIQKNLFGENYQYLNVIDCFDENERQKCIDAGITATPTWLINGEKYTGVQSIEKLKELTGC
jgi:hypothetical protein